MPQAEESGAAACSAASKPVYGREKSRERGAGFASAFGGAVSGNGFKATMGATLSSLLAGNGFKGTAGLLSAAAGTPGLLSGYVGPGSVTKMQRRTVQWASGSEE